MTTCGERQGETVKTKKRITTGRPTGFLLFGLGLSMALAVAAPALAQTPDGADVSTTPWIASDKADYPPGGHVVLTGGNWKPGEKVHINVDDDQTKTW